MSIENPITEIKKEKKKSPKTGCLVILVIIVGVFLIYFLPAIKEDREFRNKSALLALSSEDILFTSETGYYVTQCYVTNKGDSTWKGSVDMMVEDTDGGPLYASTSNAWPEIELKPGKREYLIAKIPMNEYLIQNAPQGILVIVWSWGNQKVTKRIKIR